MSYAGPYRVYSSSQSRWADFDTALNKPHDDVRCKEASAVRTRFLVSRCLGTVPGTVK